MVGTVTRPVKELKGFKKVFIKKGESKEVVFTIGIDDLKFYNSELNFVAEPGDFKAFVGGNSRDVEEAGFVLKNKDGCNFRRYFIKEQRIKTAGISIKTIGV